MPAPTLMLSLDATACTGCRLCELACVERHYGPVPGHDVAHPMVFDRRRLAIRAERAGPGEWRLEACDHCAERSCVPTCPHLALLTWGNGAVTLIEPRCTGCGACIAVCESHAIRRVGALSKAIKCDGCQEDGDRPACVRACPDDALHMVPLARTAPTEGQPH